jgi:hypothetical protein
MRSALALTALVGLTVCASAAPLPDDPKLSDKYLPDDVNALAVVNVKQLRDTDFYAKAYKKTVEDALKQEPVAGLLKSAGLDPLKDVERVYVAMAPSAVDKHGSPQPLFLFEGRFDAAKLAAAAEGLAALLKPGVTLKVHDRGDAKVLEFQTSGGPTFYAAALDKSHVLVAMNRELADAALDKAAGKKKTALKDKAFAERFAKLKAERSLSFIASSGLVERAVHTIERNADGSTTEKVVLHTLADMGVQAVEIAGDVKDDLAFSIMVTAKDKETARELNAGFAEGVARGIKELTAEKRFPALVKALEGIKIAGTDESFTASGRADAEAAQQFIQGMLFGARSAPSGSAPAPLPPAAAKPISD